MLLRYRLDKAYAYAAEHPDLLIVTSGGQGRDEWISEGQAMRDYLIEKGLPADRVLAENKSTSTEENFAFSLDILKERGYSADTPIVYVSNAFHCYRAGRYAARAGFTTVAALPAHTPWRSVLPCYLREALALAYYWVFKTSTSGPMHAMVGLLDLNKIVNSTYNPRKDFRVDALLEFGGCQAAAQGGGNRVAGGAHHEEHDGDQNENGGNNEKEPRQHEAEETT